MSKARGIKKLLSAGIKMTMVYLPQVLALVGVGMGAASFGVGLHARHNSEAIVNDFKQTETYQVAYMDEKSAIEEAYLNEEITEQEQSVKMKYLDSYDFAREVILENQTEEASTISTNETKQYVSAGMLGVAVIGGMMASGVLERKWNEEKWKKVENENGEKEVVKETSKYLRFKESAKHDLSEAKKEFKSSKPEEKGIEK